LQASFFRFTQHHHPFKFFSSDALAFFLPKNRLPRNSVDFHPIYCIIYPGAAGQVSLRHVTANTAKGRKWSSNIASVLTGSD